MGQVGIERLITVNEEALAILAEYYEALEVVLRDTPETLAATLAEPASGMWLARLEGEVVGCVVLRGLPSVKRAGECKRMYVRPQARGHRISDKLLGAMEEFAREAGLEWLYLDSDYRLKAALTIYEGRGYEHCEVYNDNPQATVFMRKRLV